MGYDIRFELSAHGEAAEGAQVAGPLLHVASLSPSLLHEVVIGLGAQTDWGGADALQVLHVLIDFNLSRIHCVGGYLKLFISLKSKQILQLIIQLLILLL